MPSIPISLPGWATNATYGAGARPWNGQANKTQPSSGVIAEGFDPENPLFADELNWVLNNHGAWLTALYGAVPGYSYGNGNDGSVILDGIATVPWATLSGSVYTLSRPTALINLTINAGISINPNRYHLIGNGALTTLPGSPNGRIIATSPSGGNAAGATAGSGTSAAAQHTLAGGEGGGAGTSGNSGVAPTAGTSSSPTIAGAGGAGGNCGLTPSAPMNFGAAGGAASPPTGATGAIGLAGPAIFVGAVYGPAGLGTCLVGGSGGGGGGGGSGAAGGGGGGGGRGGDVGVVAFPTLNLASAADIVLAGGAGGAGGMGTVIGSGASGGGGGGGGGGNLHVMYVNKNGAVFLPHVNCPGGTGGAAGTGGAGGTDGVAGVTGADGIVTEYSIAALPAVTSAAATHKESGNITITPGTTIATATFNTPFPLAPPTAGGYKFRGDVARTDGVPGVPGVIISTLALDHLTFTIIDDFQGVISWEAEG